LAACSPSSSKTTLSHLHLQRWVRIQWPESDPAQSPPAIRRVVDSAIYAKIPSFRTLLLTLSSKSVATVIATEVFARGLKDISNGPSITEARVDEDTIPSDSRSGISLRCGSAILDCTAREGAGCDRIGDSEMRSGRFDELSPASSAKALLGGEATPRDSRSGTSFRCGLVRLRGGTLNNVVSSRCGEAGCGGLEAGSPRSDSGATSA